MNRHLLALVILLAAYIVIEQLEPVSGWVWFGYWCVVLLVAWAWVYGVSVRVWWRWRVK